MDIVQIRKVYDQLDPPVWLVTAAHGSSRGGMIATTVTQASIVESKPRQLITMNKRHNTHALIEASGTFAMHLIDESQLDLVWRFGLQSGRDIDKLSGVQFQEGETGSPLLTQALAWLECRVEARLDSGDRTIYLAAVVAGKLLRSDAPLTNRRLFELAPLDKQQTMREQYDEDARLDALAIQQWREQKSAIAVPRNAT